MGTSSVEHEDRQLFWYFSYTWDLKSVVAIVKTTLVFKY